MLVGGFSDRFLDSWGEPEIVWFEDLLAEQDVDIMAWAFGTAEAPDRYHGPLLDALKSLNYIGLAR